MKVRGRAEELLSRRAGPETGAWIEGRGWDEEAFAERRLPTRADLDPVAGPFPVFLRRHCGHVAVANTEALRRAGLWPAAHEVPGGVVDLDDEGRPTGVLREAAAALVDRVIPPPARETVRGWIARAAREAARAGVTAVHPNDGGGLGPEALGLVFDLYRELRDEGELPLRVHWDFPGELLEEAIARGFRTGFGDLRFCVGAAKFFTDGSLGGHTAALFEPYSDRPETRGVLLWEDDDLAARLARALTAGFAVCLHAIGDRAAAQAVSCVERAQAEAARRALAAGPAVPLHPAVSRPRLIHCQVMRSEEWPRMARAGIVADVQPRFLASDIPIVERRIGLARARTAYAWKSIARAGVALAFGSDCPVEPIRPLDGVHAAVNRQTMDGEPPGGWQPEERLSVARAIACYTRGGAYAAGVERERGTLAPGFLADLVVLDEDPFAVPPSELRHIRPLATLVGGRASWRDPEAPWDLPG